MFIITTSTRKMKKRCNRQYEYLSHLRKNLEMKGNKHFYWFGSGIHYALEDYHGLNNAITPEIAFLNYVQAQDTDKMPKNAEELTETGYRMLQYYKEWEKQHERFETLWLTDEDGEPYPAVEIEFALALDVEHTVYQSEFEKYRDGRFREAIIMLIDDYEELCDEDTIIGTVSMGNNVYNVFFDTVLEEWYFKEQVVYHGTIDRIAQDSDGRLWVIDYKTTSRFDIERLEFDEQISAYLWGIEQYLGMEFAGMIFVQLNKYHIAPNPPKILKGNKLSTDKRQNTSYHLYKYELENRYGDVIFANDKELECLRSLQESETIEGNKFIRQDKAIRTDAEKELIYKYILEEAEEMANGKFKDFPNHTPDCPKQCGMYTLCRLIDQGANYGAYIETSMSARPDKYIGEEPYWKNNLLGIDDIKITLANQFGVSVEEITLDDIEVYLRQRIHYQDEDIDGELNIIFDEIIE